jgi:hypothetical protein
MTTPGAAMEAGVWAELMQRSILVDDACAHVVWKDSTP